MSTLVEEIKTEIKNREKQMKKIEKTEQYKNRDLKVEDINKSDDGIDR